MIRLLTHGPHRLAFGRAAQKQHRIAVGQVASKFRGSVARPGLGTAVGTARIQRDDPFVRLPTGLSPDEIGSPFFFLRGRQFHRTRSLGTAERLDHIQIMIHGRPRQASASFTWLL